MSYLRILIPQLSRTSMDFDNFSQFNLFANIPGRSSSALSGKAYGSTIVSMPANQVREQSILDQCAQGNLPSWMNNFVPIMSSDGSNSLTYFVSPDVVCLGNDTDFLRIASNGHSAKKIVDMFACILPTKKMSDQIWKAADLKLTPTPIPATSNMITTQAMIDHNNIIEHQRNGRNFKLISGHKKDIVLAKHLLSDKTRLAIYGWHYPNGIAIQGPEPNSTSHSVDYVDYSSSVRLVAQQASLNGNAVNLYDVLNDPTLASLISEEGAYNALDVYA